MTRRTLWIAVCGLTALAHAAGAADAPKDAAEACRRLGRGINLGNALEAPTEGEWGMRLEAHYFEAIKKAGFDSVRIPVRWSAHAEASAPYEIDPTFAKRVDWAIDHALAQGLNVVLNAHHYEEIYRDTVGHAARLVGLWAQIAERYRDRPASLYFELLNEPHDKLTDDEWNAMVPRVLAAVRNTNPDRFVIVGPGGWNNFRNLPKLRLPDGDRRLIATFHYYEPFQFTHQGAEWVEQAKEWKGITWTGTPEQRSTLDADFDAVVAWSKSSGRPIYLGEFGAYSKADMDSRAAWTAAVARAAEACGFAWAYWEFGSGFGAYDRESESWRPPLLKALIGDRPGLPSGGRPAGQVP